MQHAPCRWISKAHASSSPTGDASEPRRRKRRPQLDELELEFELEFEELSEDEFEELFDELFELAFENAAPPNEELLLVLLELLREPLDERLVEVLPCDIVPMKSIGPAATCIAGATGIAAAPPMRTRAGADWFSVVWLSVVLATSTSGTACAKAPVAVRVVSAAPAISYAVML